MLKLKDGFFRCCNFLSLDEEQKLFTELKQQHWRPSKHWKSIVYDSPSGMPLKLKTLYSRVNRELNMEEGKVEVTLLDLSGKKERPGIRENFVKYSSSVIIFSIVNSSSVEIKEGRKSVSLVIPRCGYLTLEKELLERVTYQLGKGQAHRQILLIFRVLKTRV